MNFVHPKYVNICCYNLEGRECHIVTANFRGVCITLDGRGAYSTSWSVHIHTMKTELKGQLEGKTSTHQHKMQGCAGGHTFMYFHGLIK